MQPEHPTEQWPTDQLLHQSPFWVTTAEHLRQGRSRGPKHKHVFGRFITPIVLRMSEPVSCCLQAVRPAQMQKGFQDLVMALDDLSLDVPDAPELLAMFVSRAIVDDILPPAFLTQQASSAGKALLACLLTRAFM